jgi:hypothetical protein
MELRGGEVVRQFTGVIRTDKQGSDCEFEFEVEDDATAEQIDAEAQEAASALIECHYEAREADFGRIEWHYTEVKS